MLGFVWLFGFNYSSSMAIHFITLSNKSFLDTKSVAGFWFPAKYC